MANNKSNFDATQTAHDWRELDVYTVPLRSRSKRPKHTNWTKLRLDGEQLDRAFQKGDNIGAILGEPSNDLTDLDLDLQEACEVAPHIMSEEHETFTYGHREKRESHFFYRCRGATTKKWQTKSLGTIVEIRSTGAQSVLPPSIHPDGDRYNIDNDIEFKSIPKRELERLVDEIAIAAVFLHYYPEEGSRHDYAHACTGALCHAGWHADKVKRVLGAVLSVMQFADEDLKDRKGTVVNTIEHHEMGDRVQGFRSLETWIDMQTIQQLRRWCVRGKEEAELHTPSPTVLLKRFAPERRFNQEWLNVDGLVGQIADWAGKAAYVQQPMFNLATGLMCTALASCNNYLVDGWDTPLQPYLMVTAPTGEGKNAVLKAVQRFANEVGLEEYVHQEFQSYYAMLDRLAEPPNMICLLWDEAARHLASAKNPMTQSFQMISHVISLFGRANEWVAGSPGRKQEIPPLEHPFLIVLATAQPDQLMLSLGNTSEETGFSNRFIMFDSGEEFPSRNRRRTKTFPSAIKKHARLLRDHAPTEDFTQVTWDSPKTYNMFDDFEETARHRTHLKEYAWARANQNALIMAGLVAVGIDAERPVITEDMANWAIEVVTWSTTVWTEKIRLAGGETVNEQESFKVQERIKNPRKYLKTANSETHRKLITQGYMPHSVLIQVTRGMKRYRREEILDDLHEAGLIDSSDMGDNRVYFIK